MESTFSLLFYLGLGLFAFVCLVLAGWVLSLLRGRDGPLAPLDQTTVRDHLRTRWF